MNMRSSGCGLSARELLQRQRAPDFGPSPSGDTILIR